MAVKSVIVRLEALVGQYKQRMAEATRSTQLFSASTLEAAKKNKAAFTELGLVAVAFGGALVFALGMAADKALEFEKNITAMSTLAGVATEEAHHLGEAVLELGHTGKGAIELSDALYFVTSSGQSGAQALRTVEASAKAAAIGLGTTMEVADAVTSAMNAYGEEALSASLATDILTAGVKFGKIEANELAPVLGNLIGIANSLGISFDDLVGTMAVLSRVGVDASEGATMLSGVMSTILSNSPQVVAALDSVDLTMAQLRTTASEDGLIAAMRLLQDAFQGNVEGMRQVVPNIRAFRAVMNALSQDAELVDDVLLGVADAAGTVAEGFSIWSETAEGAKARMGAAFENMAIVVGTVLLPAIELVSDALTGFFDIIRNLPGPVRTAAVAFLAIGAALGLFGGAMLLLLPRISATKAALVDLAGTSRITSGVVAMGAKLLNPWTVGIGLAVAALTFWSAASAKQRQEQEALTDAIAADTGVVGENTRAHVANRLEREGLLELARDAGISLDLVTDAALGEAGALAELNGELERVKDNSDASSNAAWAFQKRWGGITEDVEAAKAAYEREQEAVHGTEGAHDDATGAAEEHTQAQFDLGEAMEETISFADELTGKIEALAGVQMDAAEAAVEWEQSIDDLGKELKKGEKTLNIHEEAGRKNVNAIHDAIDAAIAHGAAVAEETGDVDKGIKVVQGHVEALIDEATRAGISEGAIRNYIRQLNLTPKQIKTLITLNTDLAQNALNRFISSNDGRRIGVIIDGQVRVGGGHTTHAGGVFGESGARRLHGGGQLRANEAMVIAERGEHVLTSAQYRALKTAAANGARVRPETHGGGTTVVNIGVKLDRRRFNKELDHDATYDGRWAS